MSDAPEPKEKILHARIPESLDKDLKAKAASLGMSVSNLVRHVLTNTLDLVEGVIVDSARIAASATELVGKDKALGIRAGAREAAPPPAPPDGTLLGWQELVLNLNALCDTCNTILPKGSRAFIGVVQGAGPRPTRCRGCVGELEG